MVIVLQLNFVKLVFVFDDGYLVKVQCIDGVAISASISLDKPSYCGSKGPQFICLFRLVCLNVFST